MNRKQRAARHGSDGVHPLRMIETQPCPLPSGYEDRSHMTGGQCLASPAAGLLGCKGILRTVQTNRRRRCWHGLANSRTSGLIVPPAIKSIEQGKVDAADLLGQFLAPAVV